LGYVLEKIDGRSMPVPDENNRDLVVKMFEYYSTGLYSLQDLIKKVRDEGLLMPDNFPKGTRLKTLTKSSVHRILRNPIYYGDFQWKEKIYNGTHEPLISRQLWGKVQNVLDRFANKKMISKYNTLDFVFKGLMTCGECGRNITATRKVKPSGREYVYYTCTRFIENLI